MSRQSDKTATHARALDLPNWPCPPRVRDITSTPNSWGWVYMAPVAGDGIAQDDLGRLWAAADAVPRVAIGQELNVAQLTWTEAGLAVYIPPTNYGFLPSVSMLDARPDQWVPVAVVLTAPKTLGGAS